MVSVVHSLKHAVQFPHLTYGSNLSNLLLLYLIHRQAETACVGMTQDSMLLSRWAHASTSGLMDNKNYSCIPSKKTKVFVVNTKEFTVNIRKKKLYGKLFTISFSPFILRKISCMYHEYFCCLTRYTKKSFCFPCNLLCSPMNILFAQKLSDISLCIFSHFMITSRCKKCSGQTNLFGYTCCRFFQLV